MITSLIYGPPMNSILVSEHRLRVFALGHHHLHFFRAFQNHSTCITYLPSSCSTGKLWWRHHTCRHSCSSHHQTLFAAHCWIPPHLALVGVVSFPERAAFSNRYSPYEAKQPALLEGKDSGLVAIGGGDSSS